LERVVESIDTSAHFAASRPAAFRTLVALVRAGLLDLDKINVHSFPMQDLPQAMDHAAQMRGLDCTIVTLADLWGITVDRSKPAAAPPRLPPRDSHKAFTALRAVSDHTD